MNNECVIYYRTACTPFGVKDEALARQEDDCRKFIRENGLIEIQSFYDRGVSGISKERKGFNALLDFLKKRREYPTAVVVTDPSRLSRSVEVAEFLFDALTASGGQLLCANVPFEHSKLIFLAIELSQLLEAQ
jgi:DNA invertase Pin-like site-specific DNA recombinase